MTVRLQRKHERGVVLALVLILVLVLGTAVTTFATRAVIDYTIVRNRDKVAVAESLARSGIHIARAILIEQLYRKIDVADKRVESDETFGTTSFSISID